MSDGDDGDPGTEAEESGSGLGPTARDLSGELAERRRERFGATAAEGSDAESAAQTGDGEFLEPSDSDAVQADSETVRSFWAAVVYVNLGIFLIVLGLLLAGLRGRLFIGPLLVGGGAFALYRTWIVYREFQEREGGDDGVDESTGDDGSSDDDAGAGGDDDGDIDATTGANSR